MEPSRIKPTAVAPTDIASRRRKVDISLVEPPPPAQKAHQLLEQARRASVDNLDAFETAMATLRDLAAAIVEDEELYGPGVYTLAREVAEDLHWKSKRLAVMALRHREAILPRKALAQRASEARSGEESRPALPPPTA